MRRRYPQLADISWLRARLGQGKTHVEIAAELGCGETTVRTALRNFGMTSSGRHGEPMPTRQFVALKIDPGEIDYHADVAADELARRLSEGLTDFAELVRLAGELPPERLWGLVVDQVDAPTARVCAFTAALLAAEQGREVSRAA